MSSTCMYLILYYIIYLHYIHVSVRHYILYFNICMYIVYIYTENIVLCIT